MLLLSGSKWWLHVEFGFFGYYFWLFYWLYLTPIDGDEYALTGIEHALQEFVDSQIGVCAVQAVEIALFVAAIFGVGKQAAPGVADEVAYVDQDPGEAGYINEPGYKTVMWPSGRIAIVEATFSARNDLVSAGRYSGFSSYFAVSVPIFDDIA